MAEGYADFHIFSWPTAVSFPEGTNSVTCTIIIYTYTTEWHSVYAMRYKSINRIVQRDRQYKDS